MYLRKTKKAETTRVMEIINQAKAYFKKQGIDQWQDGYPNQETIINDIQKGEAYVLVNQEKIIGTCMISIAGEPTYNIIEGKWLFNEPYLCVHRIAIDEQYKGQGLASSVLDQAIALYPGFSSVRMDTHQNNLSMQRFLTKYGFKYCGIITLENGGKRRAYEKGLNS